MYRCADMLKYPARYNYGLRNSHLTINYLNISILKNTCKESRSLAPSASGFDIQAIAKTRKTKNYRLKVSLGTLNSAYHTLGTYQQLTALYPNWELHDSCIQIIAHNR